MIVSPMDMMLMSASKGVDITYLVIQAILRAS